MVNRGSTSNALELDKLRVKEENKVEAVEEDAEEQTEEALSTMMSALKFGFTSLFSAGAVGDGSQVAGAISDAALNRIIDRSRGLGSANQCTASIDPSRQVTGDVLKSEDMMLCSDVVLEDQQQDAASFHKGGAVLPMTNLRVLAGEHFPKAPDSESLRDIASAWKEDQKRNRKSRVETVQVDGVGEVSVLKMNRYSLNGGELSVYDQEMRGRVPDEWGKISKQNRAVSIE